MAAMALRSVGGVVLYLLVIVLLSLLGQAAPHWSAMLLALGSPLTLLWIAIMVTRQGPQSLGADFVSIQILTAGCAVLWMLPLLAANELLRSSSIDRWMFELDSACQPVRGCTIRLDPF